LIFLFFFFLFFGVVHSKLKNISKCPLLEGLERVYLPNDAKALGNFQSRLKPLFGNLTLVHSALLSEKKIEIDTPFGVYELDSWVISKGKRAFCLVGHDPNVTAK
jgi:hypothetical protein